MYAYRLEERTKETIVVPETEVYCINSLNTNEQIIIVKQKLNDN